MGDCTNYVIGNLQSARYDIALFYIYLILTGQINWPYAIILIIFVYTYSVMITTLALLWDQVTFRYYKTWGEVMGLCLMAFLEPFVYHPLILFFSIKGYL